MKLYKYTEGQSIRHIFPNSESYLVPVYATYPRIFVYFHLTTSIRLSLNTMVNNLSMFFDLQIHLCLNIRILRSVKIKLENNNNNNIILNNKILMNDLMKSNYINSNWPGN